MKFLNLILCLLFLISATLQYNDPDPYIWIPLYLYGALVCGLAFYKKFYQKMFTIGLWVYLPYMMLLFLDKNGVLSWWSEHQAESLVQSMKATKPWIEQTREFLGLTLLMLALVMNWAWLRRTRREGRETIRFSLLKTK